MNKVIHKPTEKVAEPKVPTDLRKALAADPMVEALWKDLTPIARRDFILWVDSAKQPETRSRRIERTGSMLSSGKKRPCCFSVVPFDLYKALEADPEVKAHWKILSSIERRDFIGWIDEAKQKEKRSIRLDKACEMIAAGKRRP